MEYNATHTIQYRPSLKVDSKELPTAMVAFQNSNNSGISTITPQVVTMARQEIVFDEMNFISRGNKFLLTSQVVNFMIG